MPKKKWCKTRKEAKQLLAARKKADAVFADQLSVYKVRTRYLVGTYYDWLLAVS